jgi:carbon storage regulator CsrA
MLVISRRLGEGIVINGNIHITVVKMGQGRIRLGLTAPATVRIHRREELDGESPDGVESIGGSSLTGGVAVLPFSLKDSTEETSPRKTMVRKRIELPELVESEHGAGDSHLGSR